MNFDTQLSYKVWALSRGIVIGSTLASCATIWQYGTTKQPAWLYAGLTLNAVSLAGSKLGNDAETVLDSNNALSVLARNNTLYAKMVQQVPQDNFNPFDWSVFATNPEKYPHILLVGDTGKGKSTLVNNLAGLYSPATTLAVVPHYQSGDFPNFDHIIPGRDVGNGFEMDPCNTLPLYTLDECLSGQFKPNACEMLHALYWEMDKRYQLDNTGRFIGGRRIVAVFDEFLLYSQLPGVKKLWTKLVREARKVNITLILLVQGSTVESLDIKGEGDIRNNLCHLRLGKFAHQHLGQVAKLSRGTDEEPYYEWVMSQLKLHQYSVAVEDEFGIAPKPGEYSTVKALPPTTLNVVHKEPVEPVGPVEAVSLGMTPEGLEIYLKHLYDSAKDYDGQLAPNGRPYTRQWVIKHVWGFESKQYDLGCLIWKQVEEKYGKVLTSS